MSYPWHQGNPTGPCGGCRDDVSERGPWGAPDNTEMDQQQQQAQGSSAGADDDSNRELPPTQSHSSADDTWGRGAQTALDSLRRQNFRGKRGGPGEDRPASE